MGPRLLSWWLLVQHTSTALYKSINMSTVDTTLTSPISPFFTPTSTGVETPSTRDLITALGLQKHPEGGYFRETDRDPLRVPNPFRSSSNNDDSTRSASTTIYYLLTPASPTGHFHRNRARTVHTLHSGRGRYVVIHADEKEEERRPGLKPLWLDMTSTAVRRSNGSSKEANTKRAFYCPTQKGSPRARAC